MPAQSPIPTQRAKGLLCPRPGPETCRRPSCRGAAWGPDAGGGWLRDRPQLLLRHAVCLSSALHLCHVSPPRDRGGTQATRDVCSRGCWCGGRRGHCRLHLCCSVSVPASREALCGACHLLGHLPLCEDTGQRQSLGSPGQPHGDHGRAWLVGVPWHFYPGSPASVRHFPRPPRLGHHVPLTQAHTTLISHNPVEMLEKGKGGEEEVQAELRRPPAGPADFSLRDYLL